MSVTDWKYGDVAMSYANRVMMFIEQTSIYSKESSMWIVLKSQSDDDDYQPGRIGSWSRSQMVKIDDKA